MSAVFTGNGLGLWGAQWGGTLGDARLGQGGDRQHVNLATGNLLLQAQDEQLLFRGLAIGQVRTYNSLGLVGQVGDDAWLTGFERRVELLSGGFNQAGSVMRRHTGDGSVQDFVYVDAGLYRSTSGDDAHDTLRWDEASRGWSYVEGGSLREEGYADHDDATLQGRLVRIRALASDGAGPTTWAIVYDAQQRIAEVRAQDGTAVGDALLFEYDGDGRLAGIATRESGIVRGQVAYGYDAAGRLTSVTVDLTPDDATGDSDVWDAGTPVNNDGRLFRTEYSYIDASSLRIAQVRQSDGSLVSYTYDSQGRVATVTRGDSNADDDDGIGQTLGFAYDGLSRRTDVSDSAGRTWSYFYNVDGQLLRVESPARDGLRDITLYVHDADGNVTQVATERGGVRLSQVDYQYDERGNLLWEWRAADVTQGAAARAIQRSYTASNRLASETVFTGLDADGAASTQSPSGGLTSRYLYDAQDRLRFAIDATGGVRELEYANAGNGVGQVERTRQYLGTAYAGQASLSTLEAWADGERKADSALQISSYDLQGRLSRTVSYAEVDASGDGIDNDATAIVDYVYDAQGLLRQQATWRSSTSNAGDARDVRQTVSYVYDGMGRVLSEIASEQVGEAPTRVLRTSVWSHVDSAMSLRLVLEGGVAGDGDANDLLRTQVRNAAGQVIAVTESALSGSTARTTQQFYDSTGRLRASQDVGGARSYFFYDAEGELSGQVDATGAVLRYARDAAGRVTATRAYATRVDTSAWLLAGHVVPHDIAAVAPAQSGADRITTTAYDGDGRVLTQTDGEGGITAYIYDGAGRLLHTRTTDAAGSAGTQRLTRYFHDDAGRLAAQLDAEGYLVEYGYDRAGRRTRTTAYATATAQALRDDVTLDQLRPAGAPGDQVSRTFYDGRGNAVAVLDAEGYLSESLFDEARNERAVRAYSQQLTGRDGSESLAALRLLAQAGAVRETRRSFDALGRLQVETNAEGTVTRYHYDAQGRLLKTEAAFGSSEVREGNRRYDVFGNLVGELGGEGSAQLLPGMSETELDAIYAQYGVRHTYDPLGRRIESIDAQGGKVWYLYDGVGRLTHTVRGLADAQGIANAQAEVAEVRYNAFGETTQTLAYGQRLTLAVPGDRASVLDAVSTLFYQAVVDSRTQLDYDRRGLVTQRQDAEGSATTFAYNAFGDLVGQSVRIDGSRTLDTIMAYDRRGLRTAQVADTTGLAQGASWAFDAFGRVVATTDGRGQETEFAYDRLGRQVAQSRIVTGRQEAAFVAYDAFGRVLSRTDATGNTTTYAYDDHARTLTVTTPEGVQMITEHDEHGQTVRLTDGMGLATAYAYDLDGRLVETVEAVDDYGYGFQSTREYDTTGRLVLTTDATGRSVAYEYDAVGRVLARIVDPDGLALSTRYAYDGQGRQVGVTDPGGIVTTMRYDGNGQLLETVQDAGGMNLRTIYTWDARGHQLSVTEGAGTSEARTTAYVYDTLGRRITETFDAGAGHLNLTTSYAYDGNDNLVASTDAAGRVTRYAYDAADRRVISVDGAGGVVQTWYDTNGRAVASRAYAQAIDLDGLPLAVAEGVLQGRIVGNDARDVQQYTVYDGDGRVHLGIDGAGAVTRTSYDGAGRATEVRTFAQAISLDAGMRTALLGGEADAYAVTATLEADASLDRVVWTVYDTDTGRAAFAIDGSGAVVETRYDDAGRVVEVVRYANTVEVDDYIADQLRAGGYSAYAAADNTINAGNNDREQSLVYDGAGRLVFTLTRDYADYIEGAYDDYGYGGGGESRASFDDYGYSDYGYSSIVKETRYDASGRVVAQVTYGSTMPGYFTPWNVEEMQSELDYAGVLEGENRTVRYAYDAVGRLRFTYEADGAVREQRYNAVSDEVDSIAYGGRFEMFAYDEASFVAAVQGEVDLRRTQMQYDTAGRMIGTTNAMNRSESFGYDATGLMTSYRNRDGHLWTYQYDSAGRRTAETSPQVSVSAIDAAGQSSSQVRSIVVRTQYDALGNVVARIEDADGGTPRATSYVYDNRGNQVGIVFPDAGQVDHVTGQIQSTGNTVAVEVVYDTLGRAVAQKDVRGFTSYKVYDRAGLVAYEVDQGGFVTEYAYNAFGEQTELRRYATRIELSGEYAPDIDDVQDLLNPDDQLDRVIYTGYDTRGNKVAVVQLDEYDNPRTYSEYDAYGQLIHTATFLKEPGEGTDEIWGHAYYYYDAAGRLDLTLDPQGYVAATAYDGYGQVRERIEYARALPLYTREREESFARASSYDYDYGYAWMQDDYSPYQRPPIPAAGDETTGYDRVYRYDYDALGRKVSETTARHYRDADGNAGVRDVVTSSEYDGEGHVLRLVMDGQATETVYDALGRAISVKEAERDALAANHLALLEGNAALGLSNASLYVRTSPYSSMMYDAFGNLVQVRRFADGWRAGDAQAQASARDLVQQSRYDLQGRLVWERDTLGTVHTKRYDAADNLLEDRSRLDNGNGTWATVISRAEYDRAGQQIIAQVTREVHAADGSLLDTHVDSASQVRYNGFGEIIAKDNRLDPAMATEQFAAQYEYNTLGQLVRTNANGRGWENYGYSPGGYRTYEYSQSWNGQWDNGDSMYFAYDRLGRMTYREAAQNWEEWQDAGISTSYDRWGNTLLVTDSRGGRTSRQYNELNQLVREERPDAAVVHADGTTTRERPVYRWFYDGAGNLVGTQDANGNIRRSRYDAAGRLVESEDAYRNVTGYAYDALGQQTLTRDALGYVSFREYDQGGRVVAVGDFLTDQSGTTRSQEYRERYLLNQNGDRVRVIDALGNAANYEYDSRGLVLRSRTAAGVAMEYAYDLQGNKIRETNGLADQTLAGGTQPAYAGGLVGQTVRVEGQTVALALPAGAFTVPNGESPAISVVVERYSGSAGYVPASGLAWNPTTRQLEGTPPQQGSYRITFTATSSSGATASAQAILTVVSQANYDATYAGRPYAAIGLPVLTPPVGQGFIYTLPNGAFVDPQAQGLTYQATVSVTRYVYDAETRRKLPEIETIVLGTAPASGQWLTFDAATGTIAGTPLDGAAVVVSITARDPDGNVAYQSLTVKPNAGSARTRVDDEGELVRLDEQTWDYDYFGRVIDHNDLSGFDYDYVYHEDTGQLLSQSSDWTQAARQYTTPLATHWTQAQWLDYGLGEGEVELEFPEPVLTNDPARNMSYYPGGRLQELKEGNNWFRYEYDSAGNRTAEESYTVDANGQVLHLRTEMRYDLHNRMTRVTQHDQVADRRLVDVRYDYDANGNRVRVQTYNGYDPTSPDINVVENTAPTIGQLSPPKAYVGHLWTYQVPETAAYDREGDAVYYEIETGEGQLPEWLHWDAQTRTLSGIPPREEYFDLYLRASNIDNQFGTRSFEFQAVDDYLRPGWNDGDSETIAYGSEVAVETWTQRYLFDYGNVELDIVPKSLNGEPLPGWVRFEGGQLKFDWNAMPAGLADFDIVFEATSPTGITAEATLHLHIDQAPQWLGDTAFLVEPGVPWSLQVDASMFSDLEGDEVALGSMYFSGPSWLSFDRETGLLSGTPPQGGSSNGTIGAGRWSAYFEAYSGASRNRIPILLDTASAIVATRPVPQQRVSGGEGFQIDLPADLFEHRNGLPMSYQARLVGLDYTPSRYLGAWQNSDPQLSQRYSAPLPAWLQFDPATLQLTGTGPAVSDHFIVEITADDGNGGLAKKYVLISVSEDGVGNAMPPRTNDAIDLGGLFSYYGESTDPWIVTMIGVERDANPPALLADIDIVYTRDQAFSFTVPDAYLRGAPGETYTLVPQSLPPGVSYDSATRTFSGTYSQYAGSGDLKVAVMDSNGRVTMGVMRLRDAAYYSNPATYQGGLTDRPAQVGKAFEYTFPPGIFTATSTLSMSAQWAKLEDAGLASKPWTAPALQFRSIQSGEYGDGTSMGLVLNGSTGKLSGCPQEPGTYLIKVSANGASGYFVITVAEGTYDAPVRGPGPEQLETLNPILGQPWSFRLPDNLMVDPDGGPLTYLTPYSNSSWYWIPSWLQFDKATGTFSGTPTQTGYTYFYVPVRTADGEVSSFQVSLQVNAPVQAPQAFNHDFERGDTGWDKGIGFEIVNGGDANSGTWSAKFTGYATASIVNNQRVPVKVGQTITASCMVQQGASSAGDASGAVVLHWYDANGTLLSWDVGNVVSSGSNGNWNKSSITMQVPPGAVYMAIGGAANKETNNELWLDKFEWNFVQLERDTSTISTPETYWYAYDAENRVTVVNGKLEDGQVVLADNDTSFALDYDAAGRAVRRRFLDNGTVKQELTQYDERGQRITVFQAQELGSSDPLAAADSYSYDAVGRQTKHRQFDEYGGMKHLDSLVYDADGRMLWQASFGRALNGTGYGEFAEGEGLALIGKVDYGSFGYDAAGRLRGYSYYAARHEMDSGANANDPIGFVHRYVYQYEGRESYLEKQVYGTSSNTNFRASSSVSTYDAWGRRTAVREQTPLPSNLGTLDDRIRYFAYDGDGNILRRLEGTLVSGGRFNQTIEQVDQTQRYAYVNGQQVASGKYNGEFDVIGKLTAYNSSDAGSSTITVQAGDTLRGIAQRVYGNANLWYVLAEANSISDDQLTAGTHLRVPEVKVTANDASTFKPFNPNEAIGNTSPSLPYIVPPPKQHCNAVAMILMVVVAVVVTVFTAGAAAAAMGAAGSSLWSLGAAALVGGGTTAMGAGVAIGAAMAGGFMGSVASQVVGKQLGVVDHFSLRGAVASGLTAGITAGVGSQMGAMSTLIDQGKWGSVAASAAMSGAGAYAASRITGIDTSFSWRGIAASAVSAVIGGKINKSLGTVVEGPGISSGIVNDTIGGMVGSVVSLHTRRKFGFEDDINYGSMAADAFGNALGNAAVQELRTSAENELANRQRQLNQRLLESQEALSGKLTAKIENEMQAAAEKALDQLAARGEEKLQILLNERAAFMDERVERDFDGEFEAATARSSKPDFSKVISSVTTSASTHSRGASGGWSTGATGDWGFTPLHQSIQARANGLRPDPRTLEWDTTDAAFYQLMKSTPMGKDYVLTHKDQWVMGYGSVIMQAAEDYDLPPQLLAGVAYNEVGGAPLWIDDVAFQIRDIHPLDKSPLLTSFGDMSIQVRRAGQTLGYVGDLDPEQQQAVIASLKDPVQAIFIAAKHLSELRNIDYAGVGRDMSLAQVQVVATRYNRGAELPLNRIQSNLSYGVAVTKRWDHLTELLNIKR